MYPLSGMRSPNDAAMAPLIGPGPQEGMLVEAGRYPQAAVTLGILDRV